MSENNNTEKGQDYEFVTETIKKKPINKKRLAKKVLHSVGMGIIAGLVACVIFAFFAPKIYRYMNPEKLGVISIPEDEQEIESTDNTPIEEETDANEIAADTEAKNLEEEIDDSDSDAKSEDSNLDEKTDSEQAKDEENTDDSVTTPEKTKETLDDVNAGQENEKDTQQIKTVVIQKEPFTLEDSKTYYRQLSELASNTKKCLTKVTGVTNSRDWFNNEYESGNVSTGLIIADNGKELLIITNAQKIAKSRDIEVTFCDGSTYKGTIKKSDLNTGLVVVAVVLEDIEETTKNSYTMAELGNSLNPAIVGTPIMAIGAPLGIEDSMAVGLITSNSLKIEQTDSNIRYITTDIYGSIDGSGVITDFEGRILGIIFQGGMSSDTKNLIHAYSISDLKSKIEKLSNGQDTAYLGIVGTDVTKKAMEELGVPEGAYVKQVVVDSPAMGGGIQNGDVIVKLGTTDIKSFAEYKTAISKCQPGDSTMVTVKRLGKEGYVEFSYEIYLEALK